MSHNSTIEFTSADKEIYSCLNLDQPKSFFLFAGAGSGKTRSLVEVLKEFRNQNIIRLRKKGQQVAIITYTNAACDEIKSRLEYDPTFHVSTIHSFAWDLINPYIHDIRNWLTIKLEAEVTDLQTKQNKAKNTTTKTYIDRARKIKLKSTRLNNLPTIKKFTYNPNGDKIGKDSLSHEEVIKITADFIQNKALMQCILTQKYPIVLIDESQDTKKELVDALFEVQKSKCASFSLGLFGDTMQRIYTDGKIDLGKNIPETWAQPKKTINYRCPQRVITLINKIRSGEDSQKQEAHKAQTGIVRLFIVNVTDSLDKARCENEIASQMAQLANDEKWHGARRDVKILTLEHHMAARRGGFSTFFAPLYAVPKLKTGLIDGNLPGIPLFAKQVLPFVKAKQNNNEFEATRIIRDFSPLLAKTTFQNSPNSVEELAKAKDATESLISLWNNNADPTLSDILKVIFRSGLFTIPDALLPIAERLSTLTNPTIKDSEVDPVIEAWDNALKCNFSRFEEYVRYISDDSHFGTHQGIKGLQFKRVMVILDDDEARGFLFSYEKLFGATEPTVTDIKNIEDGKETSIDRTRRLFYVICSRAEESLAIVAYTKDSQKVKEYALEQGWFDESEILQM